MWGLCPDFDPSTTDKNPSYRSDKILILMKRSWKKGRDLRHQLFNMKSKPQITRNLLMTVYKGKDFFVKTKRIAAFNSLFCSCFLFYFFPGSCNVHLHCHTGARRNDSEVKHCCEETISLTSMCKLITPGVCECIFVLQEFVSAPGCCKKQPCRGRVQCEQIPAFNRQVLMGQECCSCKIWKENHSALQKDLAEDDSTSTIHQSITSQNPT